MNDDKNNNINIKKCPPWLQKSAWNALPRLVSACRQVATDSMGEESVFLVLSRAEEWIPEEWPAYYKGDTDINQKESNCVSESSPSLPTVLGRRLIYSHHIISKIKRADIKALATDYNLTGYMRIGWPGLLIVEGLEEDCQAFYDDIRRWAWQYLVVRGEQQEGLGPNTSLDSQRRFQDFLEVEDMSVVAQHCHSVGLEALFRTSMKVYDNTTGDDGNTNSNETATAWYAALTHVDHMNDGKRYRKWLRKTSHETDCLLLLKQCYKDNDYSSKRPMILVGIVGDQKDVSAFLKRWRTSRVDVDARGKPCLERQMSVFGEGPLGISDPCDTIIDWDKAMAEESVTTSEEHLAELLEKIGGSEWRQAFEDVIE
jgi:hypothetical protein